MTCDDFFSLLETGTADERSQAEQHAEACPQCQELAHDLAALKQLLTVTEPLSAAHKANWLAASKRSTAPRRGKTLRQFVPLAMMTLVATLLIMVWTTADRLPDTHELFAPTVLPHIVLLQPATAELNTLEQQVAAAESEVDRLLEQVQRQSVQRQASELLAKFSQF